MVLARRDNAPGYETRMGSIASRVVVGGRNVAADKFASEIHMSAHNDEAYIKIEHIGTPMTGRTETVKDGRICHEADGFKHEFYTIDSGRMKWDMLFDSTPPDTIRFRIKHSKNLIFVRSIITPENAARGAEFVVPEAENSFAVYMNKRDNKYQTGKICHIYSPYYVDDAGARSPLLQMDITPDTDNAKMLILSNTPKVTAWINSAARVGKLRLDPILGYDTAGVLTFGVNNFIEGTRFLAASNGTINNLHVAIATAAASPLDGIRLVVSDQDQVSPYDPSGHAVIAQGEGNAVVTDDLIITPIGGTLTLIAGKLYYVGWLLESGATTIKYDNFPNDEFWFVGRTYGLGIPDPMPTGFSVLSLPNVFSVWADYTEANGAVIPPHMFRRVR